MRKKPLYLQIYKVISDLLITLQEQDLEGMISSSTKASTYYSETVKKEIHTLGIVKETENKPENIILECRYIIHSDF